MLKLILTMLLALTFSSCKTCPQNAQILDVFTSAFAGRAGCGNYDAMEKAIKPLITELDYCGKFQAGDYIAKIPDGNWTSLATACYVTIPKVQNLTKVGMPKEWGCRKETIDFKTIEKDCQQLD